MKDLIYSMYILGMTPKQITKTFQQVMDMVQLGERDEDETTTYIFAYTNVEEIGDTLEFTVDYTKILIKINELVETLNLEECMLLSMRSALLMDYQVYDLRLLDIFVEDLGFSERDYDSDFYKLNIDTIPYINKYISMKNKDKAEIDDIFDRLLSMEELITQSRTIKIY